MWYYELPATVSTLTVNWGVFRSHSSPRTTVYAGADPIPYAGWNGTDAVDHCTSSWAITSLTLYGPAGRPTRAA